MYIYIYMYIYSLINNAYVRTHAGLISYSSLCSPEGFLYIINVYKYMHANSTYFENIDLIISKY